MIESGDEVTIGLDIENIDSQSFTYTVTMQIGELTLLVDVELGAYESKTISRTITQDNPGDYHVTVDGITGSFTVAYPPLPAEFVVSDLTITPEEAELFEGIDVWTFKITANVTNVGEQEGTHTVYLNVDSMEDDWRTVNLRGGETSMIVFDVTRGAGPAYVGEYIHLYTVEVDGLTGNFTVKGPKPAEFEFSDLRIFYPGVNPPEVEAGQTVTLAVSIEAENVGELEGSHTIEFDVDGEVVDSKEVTLEGGASKTVLFELTRGEGTYEVEVEGFTDSFTVNAQPELEPEQRGIPGFPYLSIIFGLLTALVFYLRNQR